MLLFPLLIISVSVPSIWAQCNERKALLSFRRSVSDFSTDIVTRTAQENENHFVTSTLSLWAVLSVISLGANDSTLDELKEVLRLHPHKCFNNKFLSLSKKVGAGEVSNVNVERSSFIFVDDKFPILNRFKSKVSRNSLSTINNMNFADNELTAQKINDYVSQATKNTIDEVVDPADIENSVMIIIDSMYFKGTWLKPFAFAKTTVSPFYSDRGVPIGNVSVMVAMDKFYYRSFQQIEAEVLELPYGKESDDRYSMLIFLPLEDVPLYRVIENYNKISLVGIFNLLNEQGMSKILVKLPRFKLDSDLNNLKELLIDMGLKKMFDSAQASFPNISEEAIYVTDFVQKAHIEVSEEGTEASAVSTAGFGLRTSIPEFSAIKPFLFMIVDKKYHIPLFIGAYSKPSVY